MASSKKKSPPSTFDFEEFLSGGPESGMQTAVRAMLQSPEEVSEPLPGIKLIPDPRLIPAPELPARVVPFPGASESSIPVPSNPISTSDINLIPGINIVPAVNIGPGSTSKRIFPVRQMKLAQDAHSRAEQAVYQKLWENAKPFDDVSRTITIGFGEMGRLVGLSESNARINTRMLIAKLAIEEHASYNCERGTGRTYRVFTYQEILNRRKQAGLTRYQRRTLAVVFVDDTGQPINLTANPISGLKLTPGAVPNLTEGAGLKLEPASGIKLEAKPGLNLGPQFREEIKKTTTTSSIRTLLQTQLPSFDDEAGDQLWIACRHQVSDVTAEEVATLFAHKLPDAIRRGIENPVGFLLRAVARSCTPAAIGALRQRREDVQPSPEIDRKYWEDLLTNPDATEAMRNSAKEQLRLLDLSTQEE